MIFESKFCIHLARNSDLANFTEKDEISFLSTDRGLVEIISLHRKRNEKTENLVLFPNRF